MNTQTILGVSFFQGSLESVRNSFRQGGLLVAPSGPCMAKDLIETKDYAESILEADYVLLDSGLIALLSKFFMKISLSRISGLEFLNDFLEKTDWREENSVWIMPDKIQSERMIKWLNKKYAVSIDDSHVYIAPIYADNGKIEDDALVEFIKKANPDNVFIQLGGGVQERLGRMIKSKLPSSCSILCTGAALAFLSGVQVEIPNWADRFYLGWLFRCFAKPKVFIPRYIRALKLFYLIWRYEENPPKYLHQ